MKKWITIPATILAVALHFLAQEGESSDLDAISAASITLANGEITSTTAVVNYSNDRYGSGTRTLCYDPAPAAATHNCTGKPASGRAGSFTLTNLTPATQYNYKITASDGRHSNYSATGTFKTSVTVGVAVTPRVVPAIADWESAYDLSGRKVRRLTNSRSILILRALR